MSILDRIRAWSHGADAPEGRLATEDLTLRDAAVALLLEAAYGDTRFDDDERKTLLRGVEREFGVSEVEAATFMDSASGARPPVRTLRELTETVCRGYDGEQKLRLMALLWNVVRSDERIVEFEQVFAEHVARAVGLTPLDWKRAKAMAESGA
jgi:uncharacterized tellurite resistance protein B-like protein